MTDALYEQIIKNTKAYAKKHPPNTGYTIRAMEAVCKAARDKIFSNKTNILVQFALLFDGKKTAEQEIAFTNEKRLPYGDSRSLDKSSDCSSWVQNLLDLFFGVDIGTWTESQWRNLKDKKISFNDMRPGDLIFWNFKSGRTVSHVALYIGDGKIIHTTSGSNPMRVDKATYSSSSRVGCVRPLTDAQYLSLIYSTDSAQEKGEDIQLKNGDIGAEVGNLQRALKILGYNLGTYGPAKDGIDDEFGNTTEAAVKAFQIDKSLSVTGIVDTVTATTIMAALNTKAKESDRVKDLEGQINALTAKIEAARRDLSL